MREPNRQIKIVALFRKTGDMTHWAYGMLLLFSVIRTMVLLFILK